MADLTGTAGDDVLIGTSDDDTINGEAGNDVLYGQDGDDVLVGGDGDDTLDGGNGSDTADYTTSSSAIFVNLGAGYEADDNGQDTLISIERVIGSDFSDQLFGGDGDDILEGGGDADLLRGRDGADILRGGSGNDYLQGGEGDDIIDGGAGTDRAAFYLSLPTDAQVGATVDLNLQGVAQDTGHGMDTLIDIENVSGTTLADTLTGDGNANWLWGQGGADVIDGQGGDDLVDLGAGDATASGGSGTDTLGFSSDLNLTGGVTVSLALQGAAQDTTVGQMTLSGFENLSGSYFNDTLTGDAGDNIIAGNDGSDVLAGGDGADTLYGDGRITVEGNAYSNDIALYQDSLDPADAGADSLSGGAGDDSLYGGSGDDTLDGGTGFDLLDGGDGFDTADYTSSASGVYVNLDAGFEVDDDGQDTLISIERVVGSTFTDQMFGGSGADNFEGGDSDDLLRGPRWRRHPARRRRGRLSAGRRGQ